MKIPKYIILFTDNGEAFSADSAGDIVSNFDELELKEAVIFETPKNFLKLKSIFELAAAE